MNRAEGLRQPKRLQDISHLFLSRRDPGNGSGSSHDDDASGREAIGDRSTGFGHRVGAGPMEPLALKSTLDAERIRSVLRKGTAPMLGEFRMADSTLDEPESEGMLLIDEAGRPAFFHWIEGRTERLPFMTLRGQDWLERNASLFAKTYGPEGVCTVDEPLFLYAASAFPDEVVRIAARLTGYRIRLFTVRALNAGAHRGLMFREVSLEGRVAGRPSRSETPEQSVQGYFMPW